MKVRDLEKKLPNYEAEQRKALLKLAVEEFGSQGDELEGAHAMLLLSDEYRRSGNLEHAAQCCSQSVEAFGKFGDLYGEAAALNNLGFVQKSMGETSNALNSYEKALSIYRNLGDKDHEAILLLNIAKLYYSIDEHLEAIEYFEDYIELSPQPADAETLYALGNSYSKANDHVRALEFLEKALDKTNDSGNLNLRASILKAITGTYLGMGDGEKAGAIVRDNEDTFREAISRPSNQTSAVESSGKFNPVDLVGIVSSALTSNSSLIESKNINVEFKATDKVINVNSDMELLSQVVQDLVSNAARNTPSGKSIYAYVSDDGERVRCEIIDEGTDQGGSTAAKSLAIYIGGELTREGMHGKGNTYVLEFLKK